MGTELYYKDPSRSSVVKSFESTRRSVVNLFQFYFISKNRRRRELNEVGRMPLKRCARNLSSTISWFKDKDKDKAIAEVAGGSAGDCQELASPERS